MNLEELENLSEKLSANDLEKILRMKLESEIKFSGEFDGVLASIYDSDDISNFLNHIFVNDRNCFNRFEENFVEYLTGNFSEYKIFKADTMAKEIAFEKFVEENN